MAVLSPSNLTLVCQCGQVGRALLCHLPLPSWVSLACREPLGLSFLIWKMGVMLPMYNIVVTIKREPGWRA